MQKRIMIEATLALSRSLGSIDSTVDSTTEFNNDSTEATEINCPKGYPLGSSLGVYGEFTCTPGISGKMK